MEKLRRNYKASLLFTQKIDWVWMVMAYRNADMKNYVLIDQAGFYLFMEQCDIACEWRLHLTKGRLTYRS